MPPINAGVLEVQYVEVDMSGGISGAGVHSWDPTSNTQFDDPKAVTIVGKDPTAATFNIAWDHVDGTQFQVSHYDYDAAADGAAIDAPSGTNAGKIRVRVEGRR